MRIAIYTLTRDRLEFTKHCFQTLWDKAGYQFDHYVVDNGSVDGTVEWLKENCTKFTYVSLQPQNIGISKASNLALNIIEIKDTYDLIIKFDNDCEVISDNILGQIVEIYEAIGQFGPNYILSPRVEGINTQPTRGRQVQLAGRTIGLTAIVGGLFHVVPRAVYKHYKYPETLPKAKGQDDHFCDWAKKQGCEVGYIEGLVVNHYLTTNGQYQHNPAYFERKWKEEKA